MWLLLSGGLFVFLGILRRNHNSRSMLIPNNTKVSEKTRDQINYEYHNFMRNWYSNKNKKD
jgi:hypothetical protein